MRISYTCIFLTILSWAGRDKKNSEATIRARINTPITVDSAAKCTAHNLDVGPEAYIESSGKGVEKG